jgi:hypothetical protein
MKREALGENGTKKKKRDSWTTFNPLKPLNNLECLLPKIPIN